MAGRRPTRNVPQVNYRESSEESEEEFQDVESSFNQTLDSTATEDNTIEGERSRYRFRTEIEKVSEAFDKLKHSDSEGEEVIEGLVLEQAGNMPDNQGPPDAPVVVDFEDENGQDGDKALEYSRTLVMEYNPDEVEFWFTQLENEMYTCTIKSQWMKRVVLVKNLPPRIQADVKSLLILKQTQAPDNIYKLVKTEILRLHAPKEEDTFKKALSRVLVGLPSQLGEQLVTDICKQPVKMSCGCCCRSVFTLWTLQLPLAVRSQISTMPFNEQTYRSVFKDADTIYLATKATELSAGVAAVSVKGQGSGQDDQVAAVRQTNNSRSDRGNRGSGRNRGGSGRGGQNRNSSGGGASSDRGPRHASQPPPSCCDNHWQFGDQSWFCLKPTTCPWAQKIVEKPSKRGNNNNNSNK